MRKISFVLYSLMLSLSTPALAGSADYFIVKEVKGKQAILTGDTNGLKAGDIVYYGHSPFRFTISSVTENELTISLPEGASTDLKNGSTLLREPTTAIKKGINTERRLKQALEE